MIHFKPDGSALAPVGAGTKATPNTNEHTQELRHQQYSPCLMCESKPTFLNTFEQYEPLIPLCRDCVDKIYSSKGQKFVNKVIRKAKAEARK